MTNTSKDVLEQLAEAVKWWNSEEADEPDVRSLFAACKAEIERLRHRVCSDAEAIKAFKDRFPPPPNPLASTMKEPKA